MVLSHIIELASFINHVFINKMKPKKIKKLANKIFFIIINRNFLIMNFILILSLIINSSNLKIKIK
jgi:hypothetical protein